MRKVTRTERGWAGHFIGSYRCMFRRNTLLECGKIKIVVSTVGRMIDIHVGGYPNTIKYREIGCDRHFETMAFHAEHDGRYWDVNVSKQVYFDSPWAIKEVDADDRANDMHEAVVLEITIRLANGETFKTEE